MEPVDVRRIGFVTRRFFGLQGLRRVAFTGWVAWVLWLFNLMESGRSLVGVAFALSMCVGANLIEVGLKTYYDGRAGRVAQDSLTIWPRSLSAVLVIFLAFRYDVGYSGAGHPSIGALLLGALALLDLIRDWPWRWYRVFSVAACAAGTVVWAVRPDSAALLAFGPIAAAEIISGYLDHRLLVGVLGAPRDAADDAEMETLGGH